VRRKREGEEKGKRERIYTSSLNFFSYSLNSYIAWSYSGNCLNIINTSYYILLYK
jgi:hypothetical protein